uniref:Uncharacterized protein n=1 Tax=Ascaris lumbricoides TaxID=6252 RepID=A0A0M3IFE8_ASCLU
MILVDSAMYETPVFIFTIIRIITHHAFPITSAGESISPIDAAIFLREW